MIEGECYNLKIRDNGYPCRLLTKGPAKKVQQEVAHYKAEIEKNQGAADEVSPNTEGTKRESQDEQNSDDHEGSATSMNE